MGTKTCVDTVEKRKVSYLCREWNPESFLTFKNRASYTEDGRTATLQMLHIIYFVNKYKYRIF